MLVSSAGSDHDTRLAVALGTGQRRIGTCPIALFPLWICFRSSRHVTTKESSFLHGWTFALFPLSSFSATGYFRNGVGDSSRHWWREGSSSLGELVTDWGLTSGGFWHEGDVVRVIFQRIEERRLWSRATLCTLPAPIFGSKWNSRTFAKSIWTFLCFLKQYSIYVFSVNKQKRLKHSNNTEKSQIPDFTSDQIISDKSDIRDQRFEAEGFWWRNDR